MVRCEVIEKFTLGNDKRYRFEDLKELQRKDINKDEYNTLYVGDTFLCYEEMALYLGGNNPINKVVVKAIEVISEKEEKNAVAEIFKKANEGIKEETVDEVKPKTTRGRKKKEVD